MRYGLLTIPFLLVAAVMYFTVHSQRIAADRELEAAVERADRAIQRAQREADVQAYDNQIAVCRRGNDVRGVVFRDTQIAIRDNRDRPGVREILEKNLAALVQPYGVNDKTSLVNCKRFIAPPNVGPLEQRKAERRAPSD